MPRRHSSKKRQVLPDPKFGDLVVTKFMNSLMKEGKKSVAEGILYRALDIVQEKSRKNLLDVFHEAISNVKPTVEVRSRRVGGATYQVPVEVPLNRSQALAIRWIIMYSSKRSEKNMPEKLAGEFLDAANNKGSAVKKKEDTHKMADANKAFSHYRW